MSRDLLTGDAKCMHLFFFFSKQWFGTDRINLGVYKNSV